MTFDVARTQRQGRFQDTDRGQGLATGYQDVAKQGTNKSELQRLIKPYKKYGVPQSLKKYKGMTDTELERLAARAVLKQRGLGRPGGLNLQRLRTKFNKGRFNIQRAKRVMANPDATRKALRQTREARQHVRRIRANRRVMATRFWSGKGYDVWKGYR